MTLRAYARHRKSLDLPGASHESVRRAIAAERLNHSLARDEHGNIIGIADPLAADREWRGNTRERVIAGPPTTPTPPASVVSYEDYEAEQDLAVALAMYVVTAEPRPVTVETTGDIAQRFADACWIEDEQVDPLADLLHYALELLHEIGTADETPTEETP